MTSLIHIRLGDYVYSHSKSVVSGTALVSHTIDFAESV